VAPDFSPQAILRVLEDHGVKYVVIGGIAATLHGSPHVTFDLDITPEGGRKNLERLSAALFALNARIRVEGEPGGLPFSHTWESLQRLQVLNLVTDKGPLDLSFTPAGTRGYDDLRRDAIRIEVMGVPTTVASLADVVRSKEAAGRPKDHLSLPTLRRMLEEDRRRDAED
jgi:hypothetical protein